MENSTATDGAVRPRVFPARPTGRADRATARQSTAMGQGASATAEGKRSFWSGSEATGFASTAVGTRKRRHRRIQHRRRIGCPPPAISTAVGNSSEASGSNSMAIGQASVASGEESTALGQAVRRPARTAWPWVSACRGSRQQRPVGGAEAERQITNVAAGTAGTDAVNLNPAQCRRRRSQRRDSGGGRRAEYGRHRPDRKRRPHRQLANTARTEAAAAQGTAITARTEAAAAQTTADTAIVRSDIRLVPAPQRRSAVSACDTATGAVSAPSYMIGGQSYGNVGSAFDAVDDRLGQIDTRIDVLSASSDRRLLQSQWRHRQRRAHQHRNDGARRYRDDRARQQCSR